MLAARETAEAAAAAKREAATAAAAAANAASDDWVGNAEAGDASLVKSAEGAARDARRGGGRSGADGLRRGVFHRSCRTTATRACVLAALAATAVYLLTSPKTRIVLTEHRGGVSS